MEQAALRGPTPIPPLHIIDRPPATDDAKFDAYLRAVADQTCEDMFDTFLPNQPVPLHLEQSLHQGTKDLMALFVNPRHFHDMPSGTQLGRLLVKLLELSGSTVGHIDHLPQYLHWYIESATDIYIPQAKSQFGSSWESMSREGQFGYVYQATLAGMQPMAGMPKQRSRSQPRHRRKN